MERPIGIYGQKEVKMKKLRNFALFLFTLGGLGATKAAFSKNLTRTVARTQNLLSWCENGLNLKEKNLQTELCALVGIDETQWTAQKTKLGPEYEKACQEATQQEMADKPLPDELIMPIYNVLNNPDIKTMLGIVAIERDPNNMFIRASRIGQTPITVARGTKKIQSEASTDQFTVLIYPNELFATHANSAEIEATIAHEIIHIVNKDDFEVFCLDKLYKKNRKKCRTSRKKFCQLKGQWERIQEKRADLRSGLLNIKYARASRDNFERNLPKKESLRTTSTHPTDRQRFTYMADLVRAMENRKICFKLVLIALLIILTTVIAVTQKHSI